MRVIRLASLVVSLVLLPALVSGAPATSQAELSTLLSEAFQAIDAGRLPLAKEKLTDLLKLDPENYYGLVLMGQLEMEDVTNIGRALLPSSEKLTVWKLDVQDLKGPDRTRRLLDAAHNFLLAGAIQPQRPEAYLGLAQLYYDLGYAARGDLYAKMALDADPSNYEAFCLLGQRYEDSGNFVGAMEQYSQAIQAYGPDSYLAERRYGAAAHGGLQPEKFVTVPTGIGRPISLFQPKFPDGFLMKQYIRDSGTTVEAGKHYSLPLFRFHRCARSEEIKGESHKDLYEAFLKSAVDDPDKYPLARSQLDKLRKDAMAAVAKAPDDKAKAQALYNWLRDNVLKKHDRDEGALVDEMLTKNRYTSVNASILYTLLAREAGLQGVGAFRDGHAFAGIDDGKRVIPIDLTAGPETVLKDRDKGFDITWWDQFMLRSETAQKEPAEKSATYRMSGTVPVRELTAYQFLSAAVHGLRQIEKRNKVESDLKKAMEEKSILFNRYASSTVQLIKDRYQREPEKMEGLLERTKERLEEERTKLLGEIDKVDYKVAKEKAEYLDSRGMDLIRRARDLAPEVQEFDVWCESAYDFLAEVDAYEPAALVNDRRRKRLGLERTLTEQTADLQVERRISGPASGIVADLQKAVNTVTEQLKEIDKQAKDGWNFEKDGWLKAIKRLSKAVADLPCSDRMKRRLEYFLWHVVRQAEDYNDKVTADEVIGRGITELPESEFARKYREQKLGRM
jgi:tetratricopeptide (TPR) repeat protein